MNDQSITDNQAVSIAMHVSAQVQVQVNTANL